MADLSQATRIGPEGQAGERVGDAVWDRLNLVLVPTQKTRLNWPSQ